MLQTNRAGSTNRWVRLNENEVGRPHYRPKKNPVLPANQSVAQPFPYTALSPDGQTLELVHWSLRDIFAATVQTALKPQTLFTVGWGQPFTEQGGATPVNKTYLYTNLQTQNGLLPNPQSFLVNSLRQVVRNDIFLGDLMNWLFSTLGTMQCGDLNRIYFQAALAEIPGAQAGVFVGATDVANAGARVYPNGVAAPSWPTVHNQYSMQTGLNDPSLGGAPDMGVVINQGRSFNFVVDPTQDVIKNAGAGWTTATGTTSGGTGLDCEIVWEGVLARSLAG